MELKGDLLVHSRFCFPTLRDCKISSTSCGLGRLALLSSKLDCAEKYSISRMFKFRLSEPSSFF